MVHNTDHLKIKFPQFVVSMCDALFAPPARSETFRQPSRHEEVETSQGTQSSDSGARGSFRCLAAPRPRGVPRACRGPPPFSSVLPFPRRPAGRPAGRLADREAQRVAHAGRLARLVATPPPSRAAGERAHQPPAGPCRPDRRPSRRRQTASLRTPRLRRLPAPVAGHGQMSPATAARARRTGAGSNDLLTQGEPG